MITLEAITFAYPHGATIFENYSWQAQQGESWAVIGPSGCGKSTLLYLLAGLLMPSRGRILIKGQPVKRPRPRTGLILQEYGLLPWATVRQNVALGLKVRQFYGPDGKHAPLERITDLDISPWLKRLGIAEIADQYPNQISGGQRQRTAIARTLALQPDLLLMDEPFSSLDAPTREALQRLTLELKAEQGLTLILVTHAIEEAVLMGEKILLLSHPPNRQVTVIENPGMKSPDFHHSQDYLELCRELRFRLEESQGF